MIFPKKEVLLEVSPTIILTLHPSKIFTLSIATAIAYPLTMFSLIFAALLTVYLPFVAYCGAPYTNDTTLHANETASNKNSWLGWVSMSRAYLSLLVTLGCKAYAGSIEFILRHCSPSSMFSSFQDTAGKDSAHYKFCDRVLIYLTIAGRPPMLQLTRQTWQISIHSAGKHIHQV